MMQPIKLWKKSGHLELKLGKNQNVVEDEQSTRREEEKKSWKFVGVSEHTLLKKYL